MSSLACATTLTPQSAETIAPSDATLMDKPGAIGFLLGSDCDPPTRRVGRRISIEPAEELVQRRACPTRNIGSSFGERTARGGDVLLESRHQVRVRLTPAERSYGS